MSNNKLYLYIFAAIVVFGGVFYSAAIYFSSHETDISKVNPAPMTNSSTKGNSSTSQGLTTDPDQSIAFSEDNKLTIYKISISAPIIFNVDGNNMQEYMTALEKGVDHLKGTAIPGSSGNSVIFGHSSYYKNKPGNYKTVFAKLNDLSTGDKIGISLQGKNHSYSVENKKIVEANDVSVVRQDPTKRQLTLITCWPVGTANQRLVIIANQDQ